jgi:hypothetical protein
MEKVRGARQKRYWWRENGDAKTACAAALRPACRQPVGGRCPACAAAELVYDGLFILTCPACGHIAESGAFT